MKHIIPSGNYPDPVYFLFWPVFVLRYLLVENWNPAAVYHPVRCATDDRIPFLELFLIPYVLWYVCLVGVHIWLYRRQDPGFRMYTRYLMITMSISTAVFFLYPTCQELRPGVFPRDNVLTDAVKLLYRMDTNTNVCPSLHVAYSIGIASTWLKEKNASVIIKALLVIFCISVGNFVYIALFGNVSLQVKWHQPY